MNFNKDVLYDIYDDGCVYSVEVINNISGSSDIVSINATAYRVINNAVDTTLLYSTIAFISKDRMKRIKPYALNVRGEYIKL